MKNKIIVITAVISLVLVSLIAASHQYEKEESRYHQHLETASTDVSSSAAPCKHADDTLCTNLPIVSIDAGGKTPTWKETMIDSVRELESEYLNCEVSFYDQKKGNNHLYDTATDESKAIYKLRGNSSMMFDKPPYRLKLLYEDGVENKDIKVLGMPKHDEWVLNGPFLDKTLIRNYLCMNIAGEIMPNTPEVRFCELVVNGKYQGLYLMMESIEQGTDRVPISKLDPTLSATSYIVRSDRDVGQPAAINTFSKYSVRRGIGSTFEVIYPPIAKLTPEIATYIERDISTFEKALYSLDHKDRNYGSETFIDMNSFVDYFIINEFFQNTDAGVYSTYYYKDIKGKLTAGPVWDFNNSMDNYISVSTPINGFPMARHAIFDRLVMNPKFTDVVISRYKVLRQNVLSEEYLINYIDGTIDYLGDAVDRNYEVWGYSFDAANTKENNKLIPDERNPKDYDAAVNQLKQRIVDRGNWLDKHIEILKQYSHESKTKKHNP